MVSLWTGSRGVSNLNYTVTRTLLRRVDSKPSPGSAVQLWLLYDPDIRKMQRVQLFSEYLRDQNEKDFDI